MILVFLSSGLFLGWSLGANDAANVFGTAVGTKMVRFKTAALICGVFVLLGAVISGAGAAHTLGKLGSVNAISGAFMVAFSAGFTVFWMTKLKVPVSTSQAIVGAIIGWNIYSGSTTDMNSFTKIVMTWVLCPILAAIFAVFIFWIFRSSFNRMKIHLLRLDGITRMGLILVGAFGSYSLGANNIANVMGVFVSVTPFQDFSFFNLFKITGVQQLFGLGGIAIALGVFTYSRRVMETVGGSLLKLSPEAALVVVLAQAIVLFLFSSESLESFLASNNLPTIPLVPVSSSQAVVGAVIGIGLLKGWRNIKFRVLGEIASGWITTPVIAGIITFVSLFFLQNVFKQEVYKEISFEINPKVIEQLARENIDDENLDVFLNTTYINPLRFKTALKSKTGLNQGEIEKVLEFSRKEHFYIDPIMLIKIAEQKWLSEEQMEALRQISRQNFKYRWEIMEALTSHTQEWKFKEQKTLNKIYNKELSQKYDFIYNSFNISEVQ